VPPQQKEPKATQLLLAPGLGQVDATEPPLGAQTEPGPQQISPPALGQQAAPFGKQPAPQRKEEAGQVRSTLAGCRPRAALSPATPPPAKAFRSRRREGAEARARDRLSNRWLSLAVLPFRNAFRSQQSTDGAVRVRSVSCFVLER
jgi:hypothetical protein